LKVLCTSGQAVTDGMIALENRSLGFYWCMTSDHIAWRILDLIRPMRCSTPVETAKRRYGEDQNVVVCKKHGFHDAWPPMLR
jgi:hypothetical protein